MTTADARTVDGGSPSRGPWREALVNAVQHAVLFLLVGPGIGGTPVALGAVAFMASDSDRPMTWGFGIVLTLLFAYLVGFLPAILAGLAVGAASARVRGRLIYLVALVAGFVAPWAVWGWANPRPLLEVWQAAVSLGGLGALAALGCTWLARHVGLGR